jgi:hypothetical protein
MNADDAQAQDSFPVLLAEAFVAAGKNFTMRTVGGNQNFDAIPTSERYCGDVQTRRSVVVIADVTIHGAHEANNY